MHSKRKILDSWRTGWKAKACTSFFLYLKVFKNHLYYLWHVKSVVLNHVYIHSFRSIIKATEKFPGVGAFDHLEWTYDGAFEQLFGLGRMEFSKIFQKFKCPGGCPEGCLSFDLTGTLRVQNKNTLTSFSSIVEFFLTLFKQQTSECLQSRMDNNHKFEIKVLVTNNTARTVFSFFS